MPALQAAFPSVSPCSIWSPPASISRIYSQPPTNGAKTCGRCGLIFKTLFIPSYPPSTGERAVNGGVVRHRRTARSHAQGGTRATEHSPRG
jgi:hypothetical protein